MELEALAARYGGVSRAVLARARELQRLAAAKGALSGAQQLAAPVASLVVAARALDEPLDAKRLGALAGVSARAVEPAVRRVLGAVGVASVVHTKPRALCIRFGCAAIAEIVGRVFDEYQQQVIPRLRRKAATGAMTADVDASDPVFAAACLFACSKQANLRVDRAKLLDAVCGNPKMFDAIVSSIEENCKASLSGAIVTKRRTSAVRPNAAAAADAADAALSSRGAVGSTPPRPAGVTHALTPSTTTPRRISPRRLERMGIPAQRSPSGPSPRARRKLVLPSADEYAAWRAAALEYMRKKRDGIVDEETKESEVVSAIA